MEPGIGYWFKTISDKMKASADADLKRHGLTFAQARVLAFLQSVGGQTTQKEIEKFLQVSHPTVVGVVSRMEQNGFLSTWIDPEDRRNKRVKLTPKAVAVGKEMENIVEVKDRVLVRSLTEEEVKELQRLLEIIYNNLE